MRGREEYISRAGGRAGDRRRELSGHRLGPYLTKNGERILDGKYDTLIKGNDFVAGPGHNAEIMEDDKKQTWIIYHGYLRKQPEKRRMVFMSQVKWKDGWPYIDGGVPAKEAPAPYFRKSKKK